MAATGYYRGHPIAFHERDGVWVYGDTGEPIKNHPRPCPRCGMPPTPEGHDWCLGHIPGAVSACCGHGVEPPFRM